MPKISFGLQMLAATLHLQRAFDANDSASMQEALRRMDAIERAHLRQRALLYLKNEGDTPAITERHHMDQQHRCENLLPHVA